MNVRAVFVWVIAATGVLALGACAKHEPPPEPIRPVKLARVELGRAGEATVFAGEVKPRHESDMGFRIGGKLVARLVDVGARVKPGQALARLDPTDVALQSEASNAAVAAAKTEADYALAEYERFRNLHEQGFVSASALDQKRNARDASRARLDQARAQQDVARNQSGYATLATDAAGVVTAVLAEVGQVVAAGQPVVRVAREEEREVAIAVPENRIDELRAAKAPLVVLWARRDHAYRARVREIAPAVDAATRTFAVRMSVLDPDAAIQWGMTASVVLESAVPIPDAALVPSPAIHHDADGKPAVWIYDPATKTVSLRRVTLGGYREDGTLVTSGLADGEWIVAAGAHKLMPGQVVKPWESGAADGSGPAPAAAPGSTPPAKSGAGA
ncbi:MAG: efflux RND transporter periplasmic adaptor subunit [Burkholderiales bacterium]